MGSSGWIEQAIRNYLTPTTFAREVVPIDTGAGLVLAVNIQASVPIIALWRKDRKSGIEYLYRNDRGKQWMNPDEVETHKMNGSRAARLAVAAAVTEIANSLGSVQQSILVELVPGIAERIDLVDGLFNLSTDNGHRHLNTVVISKRSRPMLRRQNERTLSIVVYGAGNTAVEIPYEFVRAAWVTSDSKLGLGLDVQLFLHDEEPPRITMHPVRSLGVEI